MDGISIKRACLEKWKDSSELDERLMRFDENFESWLKQIPTENQALVLTLVQHLEYYSHKAINKWLAELHKQLIEQASISDENTIFAFIKSEYGKSNSSNDYWTEYKAINRINTNICIENLEVLDSDDWSFIENIVFIDDFSGTGESFIKELRKDVDRYKNKSIYFITIDIMYSAISAIEQFASENDLKIFVLSSFKQEKAFERDLFDDNETSEAELVSVSKRFKIPEREILGFKNSQALVAFYNNTPNNTLGIVRYATENYTSLFPRKNDQIPHWMQLKKRKKARTIANYNNAKQGK